jgi:hypothetical protein
MLSTYNVYICRPIRTLISKLEIIQLNYIHTSSVRITLDIRKFIQTLSTYSESFVLDA